MDQKKKKGGKKLRRCVYRSPSEVRRFSYAGPPKKCRDTREGNFSVNVRRFTLGGIRNEVLPAYVLAQPWTAAQWRQRLANQPSVSKTDVMLMRKGVL